MKLYVDRIAAYAQLTPRGRAAMAAIDNFLVPPSEDGKLDAEDFERFWDDIEDLYIMVPRCGTSRSLAESNLWESFPELRKPIEQGRFAAEKSADDDSKEQKDTVEGDLPPRAPDVFSAPTFLRYLLYLVAGLICGTLLPLIIEFLNGI